MECKAIQILLPAYVDNSASAVDVGTIEGHLAVCNDCRKFLSELLDNPVAAVKPAAAATPVQAAPAGLDQNIDLDAQLLKPAKRQSLDEPLTMLEYAALAVALAVMAFIVFIFMKK